MSDRVTVVVPAYNEERRLARDAFIRALDSYPWLSFVFVDDGSRDGTVRVLDGIAAASPTRVAVLSLESNRGKGEAVRHGVNAALQRAPAWVGYWDADLAAPLDALTDFRALAASRPEVEVILGSRVKLLGRDIRRRAARHYFGRFFATAASLTLGVPVYDTQCGAKLFRASVAGRIFDRPFVSRWVFDVELLARYIDGAAEPPAVICERRIYELALRQWHHKGGSKVGLAVPLRALLDLWRISSGRRR
jgi:glycosyltransferase involved in cell wall biosynthesis